MKRIILFFALVIFTLSTKAQSEKTKMPINFGIGSSLRIGTLLFPSIDANLLVGPVEFTGFYKYIDASQARLNVWGAGIQLYLFTFGDDNYNFIVSYDRTLTNSDYQSIRLENKKSAVLYSKENIFCVGVKSNFTNPGIKSYLIDHSSFSVKLGISNKPDLKKKLGGHIEFNYCLYFGKNNKKVSMLGHT